MPTELTNEEKKFLIQGVWEALQSPAWTKDDLIEFGKSIFARQSFKDMPDKTFRRLFPFIDKIATSLGEKLQAQAEAQAKLEESTDTSGEGGAEKAVTSNG